MGIAHDHNYKYDKLKVLYTGTPQSLDPPPSHSHICREMSISLPREAPTDKNKIVFQLIYLFSTI